MIDRQGRRRFTDEVDNKSKAAGILAMAADTGRFLLALRAKELVYSAIGGYSAWGEMASETAVREFVEETMYDGPMVMLHGYDCQDPVRNFQFVNFVGIVPNEFQPMLDTENLEAGWYSVSQIYGGGMPMLEGFDQFLIEARPFIMNLIVSMGFLND